MSTRDALTVIQDLTELIQAIDRRSPQLQRNGESAVVDVAMQLRTQALARIEELEAERRSAFAAPPQR